MATRTADPTVDEETDVEVDAEVDAEDALFAAAQYDDPALYLGKVDEKDIDKIRVEFSGSVMLDRKDENDVDFMRRLKLGQSVELRIAATCASKKHGYTTGKEGDLDAIVFTGGLKVDTLYRLAPEEL